VVSAPHHWVGKTSVYKTKINRGGQKKVWEEEKGSFISVNGKELYGWPS
jgi:hypothetical protein